MHIYVWILIFFRLERERERERESESTYRIFDDDVVVADFVAIHGFEEGPCAGVVHDVCKGLLQPFLQSRSLLFTRRRVSVIENNTKRGKEKGEERKRRREEEEGRGERSGDEEVRTSSQRPNQIHLKVEVKRSTRRDEERVGRGERRVVKKKKEERQRGREEHTNSGDLFYGNMFLAILEVETWSHDVGVR